MSEIIIKSGIKLFHGTGEEFDVSSLRPGGYDKIFWTTDSSVIAQSYIPVSGVSTISTTEWLIKPSSPYAEQFGVIYSDIEKAPNGDVRSWRMQNKTLQNINEEYHRLSRASMDADKNKYAVIKEYEKFSFDNIENQDDPDVREKRKELRYDAKIAVDNAEKTEKELRDYNVNQKKNDYVNDQLYKMGYKPTEFDDYSHNHTWNLKLDRDTILPSDYRMKGRLLVVTPKRDMKIFDISTGESDLTDVQYHKLDLFDKLMENGYDGVKIDDFAQTEHQGNFGHRSVGFFKNAMKDLDIKEIKDVVHPIDMNKEESDEYSKYKEMFESFLGKLETNHNKSLIESVRQGYHTMFESKEQYEVPHISGKSKVKTHVSPKDRSFKNLPRDSKGKAKVKFQDWLEMNPCLHGLGKGSDGKWYGWSHRAVYGFQKGDKIKKGDVVYKGKEFTIKSEEHAKEIAQRFSDEVS